MSDANNNKLKDIVKNKTGKEPFIFSSLTKVGLKDLINELFYQCKSI